MASLRVSDHGVPTKLAQHSISLSRGFHDAHNACTVLSWGSHCADGVLKTAVTSLRTLYNLRANSTTTMAFEQGSLSTPADLLLLSRSYCAAMAT